MSWSHLVGQIGSLLVTGRLTECSSWDERRLGELLLELSTLDLEFGLEATGFAMGEIDLRIEGLTKLDEGIDPADELPPAGPAICRPGDLWLLGRPTGCSVVTRSMRRAILG